jgi:hypothetical protein
VALVNLPFLTQYSDTLSRSFYIFLENKTSPLDLLIFKTYLMRYSVFWQFLVLFIQKAHTSITHSCHAFVNSHFIIAPIKNSRLILYFPKFKLNQSYE